MKTIESEDYINQNRKSKLETFQIKTDKKTGVTYVYVNSKKHNIHELTLDELAILKEEAIYKMAEVEQLKNAGSPLRFFLASLTGLGTGMTVINIVDFQPTIASVIKTLIAGGITLGIYIKYVKEMIKYGKLDKLYYDCKLISDYYDQRRFEEACQEFATQFIKAVFGDDCGIVECKKLTQEELVEMMKNDHNIDENE